MRGERAGNLVDSICATGFAAQDFASAARSIWSCQYSANPLKRLATPMRAHLIGRATVILSGLLPSQANGVIGLSRQGLRPAKRIELEGWTSSCCGR